jgi:redox-sensitive bicupin YhaK (pirin superfamily)
MPIKIRRDADVHDKEGGWFRARWHYSFDSYRDPEYTIFGRLRVFNDDRLIPGAVWPLHPHQNVEGLTYVVEGNFGHEDDVGGAFGPLPAGSAQRMTLGSGAWHSEMNASKTEPMRFIQMWVLPDKLGLKPGVEQKEFTTEDRHNKLLKIISKDGGSAVLVNGDADIFVSRIDPGVELTQQILPGRGVYLYVIEGDISLNGELLHTGDNAQITDEASFTVTGAAITPAPAANTTGADIAPGAAAEIIFVDTRLD